MPTVAAAAAAAGMLRRVSTLDIFDLMELKSQRGREEEVKRWTCRCIIFKRARGTYNRFSILLARCRLGRYAGCTPEVVENGRAEDLCDMLVSGCRDQKPGMCRTRGKIDFEKEECQVYYTFYRAAVESM
jgi:hypothetical protein